MNNHSLRQIAANWVRTNCAQGALQRSFLKEFDGAQRQQANCSIALGKGMTKSGKACLVHFHGGQMFAFELTPQQVKNLRVAANEMVFRQALTANDGEPPERAFVEIDHFVIEERRRFFLNAPITGRHSYTVRQPFAGPMALNLQVEIPDHGAMSGWQPFPADLPPHGTLEFAFLPLRPSARPTWHGTTAAFLQIRVAPGEGERDQRGVALSNACCTLLDVLG
ncbi:MAG TPA: hypothetical protein VMV69_11800 [Pirellulales bacterium]|nr:hypothetical protein [Pirellulales bacterium]